MNIGECQIALGQPEQAIASFREVLILTPDDAEVQARLAGLLVNKGYGSRPPESVHGGR
ncbi:MAG: tetratricopeptide repeat protein [Opitutales bacterium]|nr:tetratricopeptide repeat protein [Opitutales bacterium]